MTEGGRGRQVGREGGTEGAGGREAGTEGGRGRQVGREGGTEGAGGAERQGRREAGGGR